MSEAKHSANGVGVTCKDSKGEGSVLLTIGEKAFWADAELIPLLRALNEVGLETTQHCSGHGTREAYVSIQLKPQMNAKVSVERDGDSRLVIFWPLPEDREDHRKQGDLELRKEIKGLREQVDKLSTNIDAALLTMKIANELDTAPADTLWAVEEVLTSPHEDD